MPKSKHRKGHKQKVQTRKNMIIANRNRIQKLSDELATEMEKVRQAQSLQNLTSLTLPQPDQNNTIEL